jgi:SAM domain (Sterile alpha motif)
MDVGEWLRSLGLEKYEAAFRENEVTDKVLPNLTAEDLKKLGVNALGHRRTLLDAIAALGAARNSARRCGFGATRASGRRLAIFSLRSTAGSPKGLIRSI